MVAGEVAEPAEVLVIGGGPGGYTAAARAAELGKDVVLVERDCLGGVCLHAGCIPSSVLTTAAHEIRRAGTAGAAGVLSGSRVDLAAVQRAKTATIERLADGVAKLLSRVRVVHGTAFFLDAHRVSVDSGDHGSHFHFDHAIIASGAAPIALPELPFDQVRVLDSSGILSLDSVPESLAVIGAGYIGCQLAMAFAQFGSRVSVIERADRILGNFDKDLARIVAESMQSLRINVRTSSSPVTLEDADLLVMSGDAPVHVPASTVLVAIGRRPVADDLQLFNLGIELTATGHLSVDDQCRTSVSNVYAIGDVVAGPPLAHRAMSEGRVAAEVICGRASARDSSVPLIAFTEPEIASVGLTEDQATASGRKILVGRSRFMTSGRAMVMGSSEGLVKVIADAESDVIIGVHIVGAHASDLIGEAAVAVETGARAEDVAATVHPHPTLIESLGEAARAIGRRRER
jgi:dihydrolipoamide dehydrogenase